MTATLELASWLKNSDFIREAELQRLAELADERKEAIAELASIDAEAAATLAPLREAVKEAEADLKAASEAVTQARLELQRANHSMASASHQIETRTNAIRNRLRTELADPRLIDAQRRLEDLIATTQGANHVDSHAVKSARLRHIWSVARPALEALHYRACDDIDHEINKIFNAIP